MLNISITTAYLCLIFSIWLIYFLYDRKLKFIGQKGNQIIIYIFIKLWVIINFFYLYYMVTIVKHFENNIL